jgi:plasmid stabilization system protein ParE
VGLEIRLTKRAEEDLNEIFAYIAQDNPEAAKTDRATQKLPKRRKDLPQENKNPPPRRRSDPDPIHG